MAKLWQFRQRHPKPAFSEKVQRGDQEKSTLVQMALSSYTYALIPQRLEKILAQNASPKVQEWQSYGKFRKVTLNPHFSEKVESVDRGKLFKNRLKSSPCLKNPKAL